MTFGLLDVRLSDSGFYGLFQWFNRLEFFTILGTLGYALYKSI